MVNFFEDILNQRPIKVVSPIKWGNFDRTWSDFDCTWLTLIALGVTLIALGVTLIG